MPVTWSGDAAREEIAAPAGVAVAAVAAVPADADALARLPPGALRPTASIDAGDLVAGHARVLNAGQVPSFVETSLWQMPQAWILILTVPGPGSGISRSTSSNGPFGLET